MKVKSLLHEVEQRDDFTVLTMDDCVGENSNLNVLQVHKDVFYYLMMNSSSFALSLRNPFLS